MGKAVKFKKLDGNIPVANDWRYFDKFIRAAVNNCFADMKPAEIRALAQKVFSKAQSLDKGVLENSELRSCVKDVLAIYPDVLTAYLNANQKQILELQRKIAKSMNKIMVAGDKSSGTVDSSLASTKRALKYDAFEKVLYKEYVLTEKQRNAVNQGYIYVHDMGARRDTINCCLFDMKTVLSGGFEMGNVWYGEPETPAEAFDVIASVTLTNASQIYGGFTISEIDNLLSDYAEKSYRLYVNKYQRLGLSDDNAEKAALNDIKDDFDNGFKSLEYKFNTVISSRGDYPFITISFGICKDRFAEMAVKSVISTRINGQGKKGFKRPVLFPKLVFLFDHNLYSKGKRLEYLFDLALD